jgi:hypothetical protein
MNRVRTIESVLTMRFKEIYEQFLNKEMSSEDAGYALSMSSRSFLRKRRRYEEEGFDGLFDRRLGRRSKVPPIVKNTKQQFLRRDSSLVLPFAA